MSDDKKELDAIRGDILVIAKTFQALVDLHQSGEGDFCVECKEVYPCKTVNIIIEGPE